MQNVNFSFSLISDIIVVLLLILFAFLGRKRGLIKMISGVLVLILSITAAGMLARWTTPYLSSAFVVPKVEELLMPEFETAQVQEDDVSQSEDVSSSSSLLLKLGLSSESLETAIADFKQNAAASVESAVSSLSASVSVKATYTISFIIYFIICLLIFSLLARVLNLAAKLPVINFLNRTGGFIIGAIWGYLVILVVSSLMIKFKIILTPELCEQTVVLNFILTKNPLSLLPIWS